MALRGFYDNTSKKCIKHIWLLCYFWEYYILNVKINCYGLF